MQESYGRFYNLEDHCHQNYYCPYGLVAEEIDEHACHRANHEDEIEPVAQLYRTVVPSAFFAPTPMMKLCIIVIHICIVFE